MDSLHSQLHIPSAHPVAEQGISSGILHFWGPQYLGNSCDWTQFHLTVPCFPFLLVPGITLSWNWEKNVKACWKKAARSSCFSVKPMSSSSGSMRRKQHSPVRKWVLIWSRWRCCRRNSMIFRRYVVMLHNVCVNFGLSLQAFQSCVHDNSSQLSRKHGFDWT